MTISKIIICLHMIASYQGFFQRRSYGETALSLIIF